MADLAFNMNISMLNDSSTAASLNNTAGNSSVLGSYQIEWDCYSPYMVLSNGIWLGDNPLQYALPLFLTQLVIIVLTSRAFYFLLKPFKQSMVLAEILAGVVLGPSLMGGLFDNFEKLLFPPRSIPLLSTMANLGLLLYVFMVGVEMDLKMVKLQLRKKEIAICTASIAIPFAIVLLATYAFRNHLVKNETNSTFYIYLTVTLSVTALPVLARLLRELKLINSDIGRISLSSSVISGFFSWLLLALAMTLTSTSEVAEEEVVGANASLKSLPCPYIMLSSVGFVLVCYFMVQPGLEWLMLRKRPEGEPTSDMDLGIVIMGVMVAGFITDLIGIHSVFGAFIFGLIIPHGPHGTMLIEKLEDIVTGLFLPLYFAITGLRANLSMIKNVEVIAILIFIIILATIVKVVTATLISLYFEMPVMEGLSLGFLMSSQGLMEVILFNIARDKYVMTDETYAILVIMSIVTTALVNPIVAVAYKPMRRMAKYKHHTLMGAKPNKELRMLACVYSNRNIPSIISLLDMSNATKRSPIFVCALHLVELTGWATPMLIFHDENSCSNHDQSEHFVTAFETYDQHAGGASVQPVTAIAPYNTMHDDICSLAGDKHSALIIIPFHKLQTANGAEMESTNPAIRTVNQNILNHAPCSVAILVDRGFSNVKANYQTERCVIVLFFGGPDDREALAYASRMAGHPNISLTVVRFILGRATTPSPLRPSLMTNEMLQHSSVIDMGNLSEEEKDRMIDDAYISEFRQKNVGDESIQYVERVVNNSEETVSSIQSMDCTRDLYVVGRSQGRSSPLTVGLTEWMECPELGPIGDLLASADVGEAVSVLVIQQYTKVSMCQRGSHGAVTAAAMWADSPWKPEEDGAGTPRMSPNISRTNPVVKLGSKVDNSFDNGWNPKV